MIMSELLVLTHRRPAGENGKQALSQNLENHNHRF